MVGDLTMRRRNRIARVPCAGLGGTPSGLKARGSTLARAAAVVEFAVVLPLLLTILFGIIEYGWVFMVRQTLQAAAREGARLAVLQTSVQPYTEVISRVNEVMGPTGLDGYVIAMVHATAANPTMYSRTNTYCRNTNCF